jgi:hypothetical protein
VTSKKQASREQRKWKKKLGDKNAKIKANCQVTIYLKCSKELKNTMHN